MIRVIFYLGDRFNEAKPFSILENPKSELIPNVGDYILALNELEYRVNDKVYHYGVDKNLIRIYLDKYGRKNWIGGPITAKQMNGFQ